jgi:hypothetical protein
LQINFKPLNYLRGVSAPINNVRAGHAPPQQNNNPNKQTKMKKLFFTLLCGLLCTASLNAQTTWQIGSPNAADVTATLSNDTLTISGTGAITSWYSENSMPWNSVRTSITTVIINDGITSIGNMAFFGCTGLTSVIIPNSVTSIGSAAFYDCTGLTSVIIPNSVTSIGDAAFYGCTGLTSVTIPNSVTSIGWHAFENCTGLTSVTIGNRVTSIGMSAFQNCIGLTSVTIGNSVTSIEYNAFSGCTGLEMVTVQWTTPLNINANTFLDVNTNEILLIVPQGTESVYKAHDVWGRFMIFVPVDSITNAATTATVGTPLTLTATVEPSDAINQTIVWSVIDAGTTGASLTENTLNTTFSGTVILRATIVDGTTIGTDYTQDFAIVVTCEHFWTDATCTTPKTCSVCSDTEGAALGHTWMAATCEMPKTCSVCSETEGPALDHNLSIWQITNATCDADGDSTRNCLRDNCDYTERITIPKLTGADCNQSSVVETHNYASLQMYPNPVTNGPLIIDNGKFPINNVEIYDMLGKLMYQQLSIINCQLSIDISHLPNGIYIVKIGNHSARIVKSY